MDDDWDDPDDQDDDGRQVRIVEERPPLREGKVFVDYDERRRIVENLEAAYVAIDHAFRGIWIPNVPDGGWPREYWDANDVYELESLTLDALGAVERAWDALTKVTDAHAAQEAAEEEADDNEQDDAVRLAVVEPPPAGRSMSDTTPL